MKTLLLLTLMSFNAFAFDNAKCLKNFTTVSKKHLNAQFKNFKCSDKELEIEGKKVNTISCAGSNGDFKYPEKTGDDEYLSVVTTKDKWGYNVILKVFYNAQGQVKRIRESKEGWDKDFFSSSITFKYKDDECLASEYFGGEVTSKKDLKYSTQACADWEKYLSEVVKPNELQSCINKLDGAATIHDKYFAKDAFTGREYKSLIDSNSKPISRLEENCRAISEDYDLYDSVQALNERKEIPMGTKENPENPVIVE